ncbi:MAG: glycine zipper 2TM domain-containing protein [Methylophagaceae bacterium]
MNKLLSTLSLTATLALSLSLSLPLYAGNKHYQSKNQFQDTARVTHVESLYKTVRISTPQRECWQEQQRRSDYNQHKSYTSTIAGSIAGGVVGNQFGGGNGKKIMTVAGALLGGSVGRDYNYNNSPKHSNYDTVEQCRVTERFHEEERSDGYRVTYRYNGQSYTTQMDHHPGKRIPVEVSVRPVSNYY